MVCCPDGLRRLHRPQSTRAGGRRAGRYQFDPDSPDPQSPVPSLPAREPVSYTPEKITRQVGACGAPASLSVTRSKRQHQMRPVDEHCIMATRFDESGHSITSCSLFITKSSFLLPINQVVAIRLQLAICTLKSRRQHLGRPPRSCFLLFQAGPQGAGSACMLPHVCSYA